MSSIMSSYRLIDVCCLCYYFKILIILYIALCMIQFCFHNHKYPSLHNLSMIVCEAIGYVVSYLWDGSGCSCLLG